MQLGKEEALKQIDSALKIWDVTFTKFIETHQVSILIEGKNIMAATIYRLSPNDSVYRKNADVELSKHHANIIGSINIMELETSINTLGGIIKALKNDYENDFMNSYYEIIHADIFSDFLEMANHLLEKNYKDTAAVIAGGVLEVHIKKLCQKNNIDLMSLDNKPKAIDTLNAELVKAGAYSVSDQKNVTAWYGLRTDAAHGRYGEYTKEQVALLIQSLRDFITRNPA
jgi:hypothetical protein